MMFRGEDMVQHEQNTLREIASAAMPTSSPKQGASKEYEPNSAGCFPYS